MQKIIAVIVVIIILVVAFLSQQRVYIFNNKCDENIKYGIIDSVLSQKYSNIIKSNKDIEDVDKKTLSHGDSMVVFSKKICNNIKLYYYDATNSDGKISSSTITDGLNWMKKQGVEKINISLSSKVYSYEIDNWINENKNDIKVYASYNNLINSKDYPAMYENVIGSGSSKKIDYKYSDVNYPSSKIILVFDLNSNYNGNSYLSLYTMFRN